MGQLVKKEMNERGKLLEFFNRQNMEENKTENFEEIMKELETITGELEKGNDNLDEAVNKFEKGMELAKNASKILESAEKRITILIEKDGDITEESFTAE